MQIELGLIAAVAFAGAAVQFRILTVLQVKLKQITEEHKKRDEELEAKAAERFGTIDRDREEWEKVHETNRASSHVPLLMQDGSTSPAPTSASAPNTPQSRPLSSLLSFGGKGTTTPVAEYFASSNSERLPQPAGLLPAIDLGDQVKDGLPEKMISKSTMLDDHPEVRQKRELLGEIEEIRRSIDALSTVSYGTRGTRLSLGDTISSEAALASAASGRVSGSSGRERVRSMVAMPTARPASSLTVPAGTARPVSTPMDNELETYRAERKLFVPPSGVTAPIPSSQVPETLQRSLSNRIPIPEAVTTALEERKRRESLFNMPSPKIDEAPEHAQPTKAPASPFAGGTRSSWLGPDLELGGNPVSPRRPLPTHTSSAVAVPREHVPITVIGSRRDSIPLSPPAPRVLTVEELDARHKSKMRALQEPLSRAAQQEATLAEARERWERSKAVEKQVMTRRHAERAAEVDVKLKEREKEKRASRSPAPNEAEVRPRPSRHRTSLSLDRLNRIGSPDRLSTSIKVEEWQKFQQANPPDPSAPGTPGGSRRSRHERGASYSRRD